MYYEYLKSHYSETKRFCQKTRFSILMAVSKEFAAKILVDISQVQNQHNAQLNQFNVNGKLIDSENENDAKHPIYDAFFKSGNANGFLKITNCLPTEIEHVLSKCREELKKDWSSGREKCSYSLFDIYFIMLVVF